MNYEVNENLNPIAYARASPRIRENNVSKPQI